MAKSTEVLEEPDVCSSDDLQSSPELEQEVIGEPKGNCETLQQWRTHLPRLQNQLRCKAS